MITGLSGRIAGADRLKQGSLELALFESVHSRAECPTGSGVRAGTERSTVTQADMSVGTPVQDIRADNIYKTLRQDYEGLGLWQDYGT